MGHEEMDGRIIRRNVRTGNNIYSERSDAFLKDIIRVCRLHGLAFGTRHFTLDLLVVTLNDRREEIMRCANVKLGSGRKKQKRRFGQSGLKPVSMSDLKKEQA